MIKKVDMSDCVFCRIASGEIPAALVYQDDQIVAFEDLNPQAPLHILVIPRRHIASMNEVSGDDASLLGSMLIVAKELAGQRGIDQSGYRTVLNCNEDGGQTVWHLHLHLLGGRSMGWPPG